ncbi:thiosulfate/3-mercaptopyruvate sulfurtransferase [Hephaestia caeni]|uniref:Sulfurtransferase n=1 Tax=Hephaestia caeni TaxID=645617 RepID=A0A397NVX3_9SPHN|nr:sulfurtransferase [Hephaestia caeni]RIA37541.1 thiosulfate/3-mercaptopyruvate sulfurtransferase [Hephaestia caeni]
MDALVSTEWLQAELGAPDLRVVDASYFLPDHHRDARAEFEAAHIPGATFLDLATLADPDSPLPSTVPPTMLFAARMGAMGIGDASRVVLYDDSPLRSAARAWWLIRLFGKREVAILDGGLAKWRAEERPLDAGRSPVGDTRFVPRGDRADLRTIDAMRANLDHPAEQVIDARAPSRFRGDEPEHRPGVEPGHIPGSRNLPYARLFHDVGTWKRGPALAAEFRAAGIDLDRPMTATCGSGITAAVLVFGAYLLGRRAALYDGSWTEWGGDPTTPKAKGDA